MFHCQPPPLCRNDCPAGWLTATLWCHSDCLCCCVRSQLLRHAAVTALFNDFLSWLRGRGSERRDSKQHAEDVRPAHVDKEAQAAAAAEIRQDAEDERGHAVCLDITWIFWVHALVLLCSA